MGGVPSALDGVAWTVLLLGFGYGAYTDLRTREAPEWLWALLGVAGVALGLVELAGSGAEAETLWLVVGALLVQHFVPWDLWAERVHEELPPVLELVSYAGVGALLGYLAWHDGVGGGGVPLIALAAYVAMLFARALYELKLLYGGADVFALFAAAAVIPIAPAALLDLPWRATAPTMLVPGPLTLLMDGALLAVVVPIYIIGLNLARGELEGFGSVMGYRIPVVELPDRFVWLKDPMLGQLTPEEEAIETSEDDLAYRRRKRDELLAQGVDRVWVTPQIPYLFFFFLGAVTMLIAGNLIFDLLAFL